MIEQAAPHVKPETVRAFVRQTLGDYVRAHPGDMATPDSAFRRVPLTFPRPPEPPAETAEEWVTRRIAAETERLGGLFEDLRHLTRLDWNEVVRREPVDLAPLCHELFARFGPTARQNGVALFVRARTATVVTDRRLVDTVAVNLLTNALRYTPKGGSVTVSLRVRGRDVVLAVTDTGIGISPENKDHVFDRLYRVDEARDRVSGGSGLGLAIARRAALALDGRLEVDSTVGKGSEFRLVLPRASDPIDPDRAPSTERG